MWWERIPGSKMSEAMATSEKLPAISAAKRRAGVAQCYLSKLTRKLIEEE